VDQEGKWLSPGSAFVKVRPLSTERVRRDHLLRFEARIADRAAQFDLLKRRHVSVSPSDFVRRSSSPVAKENFVPSDRVSQDGNLRAVHDAPFAAAAVHRMCLLFHPLVAAIIPRPVRPQCGAPVADGFRAASLAGGSPVEC
jgi:hypothetical protein